MEKEITYTLENPVEYALKGEMAEAAFVTLTAPTSKNMTECAFLKQAFFRALPKDGGMEVDADEAPQGELTGDAIMTLIAMSKDVELSAVLATARELFVSGVAKVEGEVKLTKPLLDNMDMEDLGNMTGEYLANFILASVLRKMKKG